MSWAGWSVDCYRGAEVVGEAGGWLLILLESRQMGNGSWRYTYSVAPGVTVTLVTLPGPDMILPHDTAFGTILASIAGALTGRAPGVRLPER